MEIFYCKLADYGFCLSNSESVPTGAKEWSDGRRKCMQSSSDDPEVIRCDSKEVISEEIKI